MADPVQDRRQWSGPDYAWLIQPDLFTARECSVVVDRGPGPGRGRTIIDRWRRTGATYNAILLETLGTLAGSALRSRVRRPKLTTFDATGGLVLGTLSGLAIVWVLGAVALMLPGQTDLRRGAQSSALLQRLNEVISPTDVLDVLARISGNDCAGRC